MNNDLSVAVLAGLGGMIGWGLADFFAKKTVDEIGSIKSLVWAHLFGTSIFAVIAILGVTLFNRDVHIPNTTSAWLGLAFFGTLQMIVYWLVYEGFSKGQLAVLNPVFASYSGLVALISIVFLGESLTPLIALGLIAVFGGIICLNLDLKGLSSKRLNIVPGLKEVGVAAVLAAFWTIYWSKFVAGKDSLSYALFMYAFMSIAAYVIARLLRTKLSGVKQNLWKFLVLIGAGEVLAYFAISWGFSTSSRTSVIALISGSFSVPTVILAYFFLKERVTKLQAIAIVIIIAGIACISLA
jgi:drug/metabolite transporter (DMT)-like permease